MPFSHRGHSCLQFVRLGKYLYLSVVVLFSMTAMVCLLQPLLCRHSTFCRQFQHMLITEPDFMRVLINITIGVAYVESEGSMFVVR